MKKHEINEIIDKYMLLLKEFFDQIESSPSIHALKSPFYCVFVGVQCIHRVFEHILMKTQSIENAFYYSKKTFCYYLEYMEQIQKSNGYLQSNHIDAVMFVYKKTIFHTENALSTEYDESEYITNIMTLQNNTISLTQGDIESLCNKILKIVNILFYWQNREFSINDRKQICEKYIEYYLVKYMNYENNIESIISCLNMIMQKVSVKYSKYDALLGEFSAVLNKTKKKSIKGIKLLGEHEQRELFLTKFYIEESVFLEKLYSEDLSDLIKWLL